MTREEAIEYIDHLCFCAGCGFHFGDMTPKEADEVCSKCEHRQFVEIARQALTQPQVISCKECKYFKRSESSDYCAYDKRKVMSADFCSFGERKNNG